MSTTLALPDNMLLTHVLNDGIKTLAPLHVSAEVYELARPYLAPAVTWACFTSGQRMSPGQERAALMALSMIVSTLARPTCAWWLDAYGNNPDSAAAIDARLRNVQHLPVLSCDDYVRAMSYWSTTGVWEYLLVRQFCDPFNPRLRTRCSELTGKTCDQLMFDYHTAWACRPSLLHCKPGSPT